MERMSALYSLWNKLSPLPQGKRLFSFAYAQKAPYFASIHPLVTEVRPNHAAVRIAKRRGVTNHLGTVHAIALCNGLEMAMGALAEASVPPGRRWIPRGMEISYTAKADSDVTCFAETQAAQWAGEEPELPVRVWGTRKDGTVVIEGEIRLWVTDKPGTT